MLYPSTPESMIKAIQGIYAPQKAPSVKYPPSSYPQKSNYQTLVNLYNNYPTSKQRIQTPPTTKGKPTQKPTRKPKRRVGIISFNSKIEALERAHKKRGKFVWDIRNPVPTLSALTGEDDQTKRRKRTKRSRRK